MYNMAVVDQISPSLAHIARGWSYRQINEAIAIYDPGAAGVAQNPLRIRR
jgi:hypothetical protein